MMTKYPNCIPLILVIHSTKKHSEKFAVRAKHMSIDSWFNKYIKNIQHKRTIQDYLIQKAGEVLIPKLENHNVDRSVSWLRREILRR